MNPTFIESQPHACDEGQKKEPLCTEINLMLMMRIKGKVHKKTCQEFILNYILHHILTSINININITINIYEY